MIALGASVTCAVLLSACAGSLPPVTPSAPLPEAASGAAVAEPALVQELEYAVRVTSLDQLNVRVCFTGGRPEVLIPGRREAGSFLTEAEMGGVALTVGSTVTIPNNVGGRCVEYEVNLRAPCLYTRLCRRSENAIVTDPGLWLWRPRRVARSVRVRVRFELPEGHSVSSPWRVDEGVHSFDLTGLRRLSYVAMGELSIDRFEAAGTDFQVVRFPGELAPTTGDLREWVRAAAMASGSMSGDGNLPVERVQIIVSPVGPSSRPVAFGLVGRGGGISMLLMVHANADPEALIGDWVLVHELAHLWHPRLQSRDAWFYEGIATYYQEVFRARAGLQTPARAWQRIYGGLTSLGRSPTGNSLEEDSRDMHRTFAYRRVYWGGVAYALSVDVAIRKRTNNRLSLDAALGHYRREGPHELIAVPATRLISHLDAFTEGSEFADERVRHLPLTNMFDPRPVLASIGVFPVEGGQEAELSMTQHSQIRDAIMQPMIEAE